MKRLMPLLGVFAAVALAVWLLLGSEPGGNEPFDPEGFFGETGTESGDLLSGTDATPLEEGGADLLTTEGGTDRQDGRPTSVRVQGRVVDHRRQPVPGVPVQLSIGRSRPVSVETGADGQYVFELPTFSNGRRRGTLFARDDKGRVATDLLWVPAGTYEMLGPTLSLSKSARLLVRVVRDGAPVPGAQVAVTRRMLGAPSVLASRTADAEGRVLLEGLPAGTVEVYACAPGSGRRRAQVAVPREDEAPLELALPAERRLEVTVVDARTNNPVAGAEVLPGDAQTMPDPHGPGYVPLWRSVRTDRRGRAVLTGLSAEDIIYVNARAPGYALAPWWMSGGKGIAPDQSTYTIALRKARDVSFPVSAGGAGPPAPEASLRVELAGAGNRTVESKLQARMEDDLLIVSGLPPRPVNGVVITPSGAQGRFLAPNDGDMGGVVTFYGTRDITIRAVDAGGTPQPDVWLRLDAFGRAAKVVPRKTDADGIATFNGVGGEQVGVYLVVPDQPASGILLTKLDLKEEQDVYEVELQARQQLTVNVFIDDEPQLPGVYTLMVGERRVGAADIEEDPVGGQLRAWVRLAEGMGEVRIALHAQGFQPATLEIDAEANGLEVGMSLSRTGSLSVIVSPPEDGVFALQLQRWDGPTKTWRPATGTGASPAVELIGPGGQAQQGGERVYEGLATGRYRAIDARSGAVSKAVDVRAGGARPQVRLDLGSSGWIEGRVVVPVGADVTQARVLVAGRDDPANVWSGVRAAKDGSFKLRGRAGEKLQLTVTHPRLRAAASGGRATADPTSGPVELRLEAAATTRFRLAGYEQMASQPGGVWLSPVRVQLHDPSSGALVRSVQPLASAGEFEFGGYEPGTYRLVMVFNTRHAPWIQARQALGDGVTDLGTITPSEGTTLVVRLRPSPPEGASIWATAVHEGDPAYTRQGAWNRQTGELRCAGLGAGRFQVTVRGANLAPGSTVSRVLFDEVIELSGSGERTVDVRTR